MGHHLIAPLPPRALGFYTACALSLASPFDPAPAQLASARLTRVATLCVAMATLYQLALVVQPLRFLCEHLLVDDDAYYYLRIARQIAADGRSSFDGIHASNGVQLAWTALLVPLARLVPGDVAFLRAALALGVGFNLLAGLQLARLGQRLHSEVVGLVAALAWCGAMIAGSPTLNAMEYSLDACLLIAAIGLGWRLWRQPAALDRRRLAAAVALAALLVWTRLDAAPFALLLAAVAARAVLRSSRGAERWRRLVALGVGGLAAAALYVAAMQAMAGTPTPISGLAKQLHAARHFEAHGALVALAGHVLWWVAIVLRAALAQIAPWVQHGPLSRDPATLATAIVLLALLLSALVQRARAPRDAAERPLAGLLLTLFAAAAAHVALMVGVIGHFAQVTSHYYALLTITCSLTAGVLVARWRWADTRIGIGALVLLAVWLTVGIARVARADDGNLRVRRLALAAWIDAQLPSEARVGAWNAGQLGYFSHRPVVNLDGLANDRDYLEFLRSRRPLEEYLAREEIGYLADYDASDLGMSYRFRWDPEESFRGTLPWRRLAILHADTTAAPPLYVVALRPVPR